MSRFNLALLADEAVDGDTSVEATDEVVAAVAEDPAQDMAAANDSADVMAEAEAIADQGAADTKVLDAAADQVEEANETEGGLSAPAAEAIRILVDGIRARNGMAPITGFAKEGFASKTSRVKAGKLAVESIQSTVKDIWNYIVKMYEKVRDWLKKWFNNFFDGATKLKNKAEKLKKAAENKAGETFTNDTDKKLVAPSYATKLQGPEGMPTGDDIKTGWDKVVKAGNYDEATLSTLATDTATQLLSNVSDAKKSRAICEKYITAMKKEVEGYKPLASKDYAVDDDVLLFHMSNNDVPFGRTIVAAQVPKNKEDDLSSTISKIRVRTVELKGGKTLTNMDLEAATPEQVAAFAASIMALAKMLLESKKMVERLTKQVESVVGAAKRVAADSKDEAKDRAKEAGAVAKSALSTVTGEVVTYRQLAITCADATLAYGFDSLKALNKKAEKEDEDK
jgi:hypothetical protein